MPWKEIDNTEIEIFQSEALKSTEIANDLIIVLKSLETFLRNKVESKKNQILIYVDATNGEVVCSGYNNESQETDNMCYNLDLTTLWENYDSKGYNAHDFDYVVKKGIKKALRLKTGKEIKSIFEIFYQNEEDDPKKIR